MPELSTEIRREGLAFAEKLTLLAVEAPDVTLERAVHSLAQKIRRRYGFSAELKKAEIVRIVRLKGGASIKDIVAETGWHKDEVYSIVREMENEQPPRVECRTVHPAGGYGGRPRIVLFLPEF
jgi:hypothetical protein